MEVTATATLQLLPSATTTPPQQAGYDQDAQMLPSDPTATPFVHVVQEGDTLLSIALTYGVGLEELVLVNPGIDPQFLSVGTTLRIPGPEGEAVDVLLPTPTPVTISPSRVLCFEALTGEFRCFAAIHNDLSVAIEAISGIIGLYDDDGVLLAQKSTESMLQLLPPGRTIPLAAVFTEKPTNFAYGQIQILSAIQIDLEVSRSVPVEPAMVDWQVVENQAGAVATVQIAVPSDLEGEAYNLRILAMALDKNSGIVGYRLIEEVVDPTATEIIDLDFYVLSLGPPISEIQVVAELIRSS
jgi:LysM repeat protein